MFRIGWISLVAASIVSLAQTPDTATLRGRVVDASQGAMAGVQVTVINSLTGLKHSGSTDSVGAYVFGGLPVAGTYELTATKPGFADGVSKGIQIAGGTTVEVDLQLAPAGSKTEVTITGAVGEIRPDSPQLGNYLSAKQIEETPLLNRRIT